MYTKMVWNIIHITRCNLYLSILYAYLHYAIYYRLSYIIEFWFYVMVTCIQISRISFDFT